jgi:hypothetical protein
MPADIAGLPVKCKYKDGRVTIVGVDQAGNTVTVILSISSGELWKMYQGEKGQGMLSQTIEKG